MNQPIGSRWKRARSRNVSADGDGPGRDATSLSSAVSSCTWERERITGGRNDFDFLVGDWAVRNRRLRERGVGATEWDVFQATSTVRPHLGGLANVDEITFPWDHELGNGRPSRQIRRGCLASRPA